TATTTLDVLGTSIPAGNLVELVPSFNTLYQWQANVDYTVSAKDQLRGRFLYDRFRAPLPGTPGPEFLGTNGTDNRLFSLTEVHNFSGNLLNEFRFGYRRQVFAVTVPTKFADYPKGDFPNIDIDELGLVIGPDGNSPQSGIANVYQFVDNVSWARGRHQFKFGADFRNAIAPSDFLPRGRGEYDYNSLESFLQDG